MVRERFPYLDALRGFALVLMVINHTARYWLAGTTGWVRYELIYVTTSLAGPIFLFLVGFVLPMSFAAADRPALKYLRRGAVLFAAGYLLNVVVFPEQPWLASNVLHTIGLAVILATPALYVLHHAAARYAFLALAVVVYATFSVVFEPLSGWVEQHRTMGALLFSDFPLWPWMSLVLLGLVLGWAVRQAPDERARARYFTVLGLAGAVCLAAYGAHEYWAPVIPRFTFTRDFILNQYWIPRGATAAGVVGAIFCSLAAMYYLTAVRGYRLAALVLVGRTALMLYLAHHVIVVNLGQRALGVLIHEWWVYWLANVLLMAVLVGLAGTWLATQRVWRRRQTSHVPAAV